MVDVSKRSLFVMLISVGVIAFVTLGLSALIVGPPAIAADGLCYSAAAMRLINTGVYSYISLDISSIQPPNAFIVPGYILLLSFIYLFLPHAGDMSAAISGAIPFITLMHFICAVGTVTLIAATAHKIAGLRLGWIAGITAALYLPFGAESMSGWPENVGLFLSTVCLFLSVGLFQSSDKDSTKWMTALGVCGGLAVMVRPVIILWLLVPMCFWGWKHRGDLRRSITVILIGCMSILLVMSPWILRNAVELGRFIPLTTHIGTVWIDTVGGIELSPEEQIVWNDAMLQGKDGYKAVAFDRLRAKWEADPAAFIAWKLQGVGELVGTPWASTGDPSNPLAPGVVTGKGYRPMSQSAYALWTFTIRGIHGIVLVLGLAGLLVMRRKPITWLLASVPLYCLAVNTTMLPWNRYFYPAMPAVILLASICVGYGMNIIAKRMRRGAAGRGRG